MFNVRENIYCGTYQICYWSNIYNINGDVAYPAFLLLNSRYLRSINNNDIDHNQYIFEFQIPADIITLDYIYGQKKQKQYIN